MMAAAIFSVPAQSAVPLSQLLRVCGIRLPAFFEPYKKFLAVSGLAPALDGRRMRLQQKYVIGYMLYHNYSSLLFPYLFK